MDDFDDIITEEDVDAFIRRNPGIPPKEWIAQIFDADAAKRGGIVRRKAATIDERGLLQELTTEVKRRGFHLVRTGDQYVILCNAGEFRVVC